MKMCVIIEEFLYAKKIENQTQRTLRGYKNGAAKEWMQCRDSQRKKKQRLKVHTKCSETWKNGFELRKRRKYTIKTSQNRVAKVHFRTKSAIKSLPKGCAATVT